MEHPEVTRRIWIDDGHRVVDEDGKEVSVPGLNMGAAFMAIKPILGVHSRPLHAERMSLDKESDKAWAKFHEQQIESDRRFIRFVAFLVSIYGLVILGIMAFLLLVLAK